MMPKKHNKPKSVLTHVGWQYEGLMCSKKKKKHAFDKNQHGGCVNCLSLPDYIKASLTEETLRGKKLVCLHIKKAMVTFFFRIHSFRHIS